MKSGTRAGDVMSSPVRSLSMDATLREAAALLVAGAVSGVPVLDEEGRATGVFSLRDLANYLIDTASPRSWDVRVSEIMTHRVITVPPDATIEEVMSAMNKYGVHRVFVEKTSGELAGVVSASDLVRTGLSAR